MDITPLAKDLWEGIGGHFDSFTQILCEFIDNSISNIDSHKLSNKSVEIRIEKSKNKNIKVIIEDTGTGIEKFETVLRLGDRTLSESPLNEHGFGLKHALASGNHDNDSWKIHTRTKKDVKKGEFRSIAAPYDYHISEKHSKKAWPGSFNGTGTIVEFECSEILFYTVRKGIRGSAGFETCLDYLKEDLGYIYSGVIKKGLVTINIKSDGTSKAVEAVLPDWAGFYKPHQGSVKHDLGDGEINIEYSFGEMKESNYKKYYKRNLSTSGVELRMNGRLLVSNLFKGIWGIENHPHYNHFLVQINMVSNERNKLPKTRTSKNGIRSGDEKLNNLFEWIRNTCPEPPKDIAGAQSEQELVEEMADLKNKHLRDRTKRIEREFRVFKDVGSPVKVDLYVFDGRDIVLYEAKKDEADVQNVYQLLMYWDGAVSDGLKPLEGILIASTFSKGVDDIFAYLNSRKDQEGNKYNFTKKTWHDEGVQYPKI